MTTTASNVFFVPSARIIQSITQANPAVVTTTQPHGYDQGLYVRIDLPGKFGMRQLNFQVFLITVLSPTTFSIPINTTNFDAFTTSGQKQSPQAIPVAEVALTLENAEKNGLPPI